MPGRGTREWPKWRNPDGSYLSEDQMVKHMVMRARMDARAYSMWTAMKLEDVEVLHQRIGREMREDYGLWDPENPYAVQAPPPNGGRGLEHPLFPTSISVRVFERVWGEFHR